MNKINKYRLLSICICVNLSAKSYFEVPENLFITPGIMIQNSEQ